MRHRVTTKTLSRDTELSSALANKLASSLILQGRVETTLVKAKYIRPFVEKLVTRAKNDSSFANIKLVTSRLHSKEAVKKLFADVAPKYKGIAGGYTRIVKTGERKGDNAPTARIEFTEVKAKEQKDVKQK